MARERVISRTINQYNVSVIVFDMATMTGKPEIFTLGESNVSLEKRDFLNELKKAYPNVNFVTVTSYTVEKKRYGMREIDFLNSELCFEMPLLDNSSDDIEE